MNVYETIDELFAQVAKDLAAERAGNPTVTNLLQTLQRQVICTIAIGQQLPVTHVVQSLESMSLPLHCEPK
jgi:hypothetical protein